MKQNRVRGSGEILGDFLRNSAVRLIEASWDLRRI